MLLLKEVTVLENGPGYTVTKWVSNVFRRREKSGIQISGRSHEKV